MRRASVLFVLLSSLASPFAAHAQAIKPIAALPPEGFDFRGNWACIGTFRGNQAHKADFTGAVILEGKWLELTEKDVEPATRYMAKYLIGYDPQQNRLVEFDANNFGAAIYSSAEGWQDHALAMISPVSEEGKPAYAANRFLYSTTGSDTFTVDWQISKTAALEWVTADHLVCKRQEQKA